ncbi:hypothetical protein [Brooklawnia sp.]|uniref:hypothetical protein n=1 Tax=Brooklawnia sp. TaxID=2699740 RepID=UPI00311D7944
MSALQAPINPGPDAQPTVLRAVPRQARQLAQLPFILFIAALLGGGLTGVLILSTTIQTQSGELTALQTQEAELRYQEAALVAQAQGLRSSQSLAEQAWALGMRPNPNPAFIKMPNGEILGVPVEVTGDELPGMVPPVAPVTDTASSPAADATATPTSPQASASSEPTASAAAEAGTQATEPESTTTSSAQTGEPAAEATP